MRSENCLNLLRCLVLAVLLVGLAALVVPASVARADSVVVFPDGNLEAAIRETIGKPEPQDMLESDLATITSLNAANRTISDLTGLQHCHALTALSLHENEVRSLAPLSGLTGLTTLGLNYNQVTDLEPLSRLTNLQRLGLDNNQVVNLKPLTGLAKLTYLRLSYNQVTDIAPLSGLTNMTSLFLLGNQVSSIAPLSGLRALTGLWLNENQISDVTPLSGLTSLSQLGLGHNQIVDVTPLSSLTNLTQLSLDSNRIEDVSPLVGLTALTGLSFEINMVRDLQPLVDNPGIGSGDAVVVRNNPLNAYAVNTCIPTLEERGVTVTQGLPDSQKPNQPENQAPPAGDTEVVLGPTLRSSAFSDRDAEDTQVASQWQVTATQGDYSRPVFDSNTDNVNLTSIKLPRLKHSTTYYWRVAYQDENGDWSSWSEETSFRTVSRIPFWSWVVMGIAVVLALGVVVFLARMKLTRKQK